MARIVHVRCWYPEDDAGEEDDGDLGTCPYYARYEGLKQLPWYDAEGICYAGCSDEPQCVTCVPPGGWPSVRAALGYPEDDGEDAA